MVIRESRPKSFNGCCSPIFEAGSFSREKAHYWWRTIFTDDEKRTLLAPEIVSKIGMDGFPLYDEFLSGKKCGDFTAQCLYADLKVWLAGNNLYKVDTMSMAHGLEARVPFLDHELVEYMARLPIALKFRGNTLKYLLKKIIRTKLPESILNRPKAGWHSPVATWFRGELRDWTRQSLLGDDNPLREILNSAAVENILDQHASGKRNNGFKIWGLMILNHWWKQFITPGQPAYERACS